MRKKLASVFVLLALGIGASVPMLTNSALSANAAPLGTGASGLFQAPTNHEDPNPPSGDAAARAASIKKNMKGQDPKWIAVAIRLDYVQTFELPAQKKAYADATAKVNAASAESLRLLKRIEGVQAKIDLVEAQISGAQSEGDKAKAAVKSMARDELQDSQMQAQSFAALISSQSSQDFVDYSSDLNTVGAMESRVIAQSTQDAYAGLSAEQRLDAMYAQIASLHQAAMSVEAELSAAEQAAADALAKTNALQKELKQKNAAFQAEAKRKAEQAAREAAARAKAAAEAAKNNGGKIPGGQATGSQVADGAKVVKAAITWLGVPYVYGGSSRSGVDCSGLVMQVYWSAIGMSLPHSAGGQAARGHAISQSDAIPGDLVYYPGRHVGIWVGPGMMIHAPQTGEVVKYASIYGNPTFVRILK